MDDWLAKRVEASQCVHPTQVRAITEVKHETGRRRTAMMGLVLAFAMAASACPAAEPATASAPVTTHIEARAALSPEQWTQVESATDRALAWLASQQQSDGSFRTLDTGQPAVTSLCALAFLACGHLPGEGRYGQALNRAIQYALDSQQPDGVFSRIAPVMVTQPLNASFNSNYNHSITGLMLSEVCGMTRGELNRRIRPAIKKAIQYASQRLPQPKRKSSDEGGWRYRTYRPQEDADLSITSWHLMFFRSCKNAGFDVPVDLIDDALGLVGRLYRPALGTFVYGRNQQNVTRAMAGAGILSFSLGGRHGDERAQRAGEFLLKHPLTRYNQVDYYQERYFYSTFYSSQAMFQLGGRYWSEFYPALAGTLIANQHRNGSWDPDYHPYDKQFGKAYTTALAVLTLSPPYQLLPVFQR